MGPKITIAAYTARPGDWYAGRLRIVRVAEIYDGRRVEIYLEGADPRPLSFERSEPITVARGDV